MNELKINKTKQNACSAVANTVVTKFMLLDAVCASLHTGSTVDFQFWCLPNCTSSMSGEDRKKPLERVQSRQWSCSTLNRGLSEVMDEVKRECLVDASDEELKRRLKAMFSTSMMFSKHTTSNHSN